MKKCKISDELADFMNADTASRPEVVKKLWAYIKKHDLQDPDKRRIIIPDDTLAPLIGAKPIDMMKMTKKLSEHFLKG
jgi:chromatin remodeling complex protein RSC6